MKSIGFGLERTALIAVYRPWLAAAIVVVVFVVAGFGIANLKFDDNLRNVFGGSTDEMAAYVDATRQFVDPENQLILLVEGDSLGNSETFSRLRELQFELQFVDGVGDVFSLFALRKPPDANGEAPLLVDDSVKELTPDIVARIRSHPLLGEKLISSDATAMIYVITPEQNDAPLSVSRAIKAGVESTAADVLAGTDLTTTITGFPAIRVTVVDVLLSDTRILNAAGALLGFILNFLIFGSLTAACMIALPSIISSLVIVGGLGAFGIPVSIMSNVVPVLVMILGFANSMHLCRAWRVNRDAGSSLAEAARQSICTVGPACILAALTTSVAFFSLVFSDVKLVSDFGMIGAIGCMVGALVVLLLHGLLAITIGRFWKKRVAGSWTFIDWLGKPSAQSGRFAADFARPICLVVFVLVVVLGAMYAAIQPEYSVKEHLARTNAANAGLTRIDEKLGGAFPIQIIVPLDGSDPTSPANLKKIGAVHRAVAAIDGVSRPLSLWSLVEWLGEENTLNRDRINQVIKELSPQTQRRFVGTNGSALISTNVQDAPTAVTEALVDKIEAAAKAAGGDDVIVTGVTVITARGATRTISNLNRNLLGAILSGLAVIFIAFRSWRIAITSVVPNILPLLGTGALIYLSGRGMQFSSVLALTIAFGIAVDGTIHYFNYFFRVSDDSKPLRANLIETSRKIGPQLFGTTAVIVVGLMTTQLSQMPTIVLFGMLVAATLVIGLIGTLVVLPALMAGVARRWFTRFSTVQPATRGAV